MHTMRAVLVATLALVGGCLPRGNTEPLPRQEEAIAIVWYQMYEMTDEPPTIEWIDDMCDGRPGFMYDGDCVLGLHEPRLDLMILQKRERFSDAALDHESLHAAMLRRHDNPDNNHRRPEWDRVEIRNDVPVPIEQQSLINRTRAALRDVGL